jgi:hypothetical protein
MQLLEELQQGHQGMAAVLHFSACGFIRRTCTTQVDSRSNAHSVGTHFQIKETINMLPIAANSTSLGGHTKKVARALQNPWSTVTEVSRTKMGLQASDSFNWGQFTHLWQDVNECESGSRHMLEKAFPV